MKFLHCTIHVKDLEKSVQFYTDIVGLEIHRRFGAPGHELVFLGGEGSEVELIASGETADIGKDISIGFEVDSLADKLAFVQEKGVAVAGGPFQPNPRVKFFYVQDPDGLKVQFLENVK